MLPLPMPLFVVLLRGLFVEFTALSLSHNSGSNSSNRALILACYWITFPCLSMAVIIRFYLCCLFPIRRASRYIPSLYLLWSYASLHILCDLSGVCHHQVIQALRTGVSIIL